MECAKILSTKSAKLSAVDGVSSTGYEKLLIMGASVVFVSAQQKVWERPAVFVSAQQKVWELPSVLVSTQQKVWELPVVFCFLCL